MLLSADKKIISEVKQYFIQDTHVKYENNVKHPIVGYNILLLQLTATSPHSVITYIKNATFFKPIDNYFILNFSSEIIMWFYRAFNLHSE